MIDPKRSQLLIRQHFAEVNTEQFVQNLQKHCSEVFSESDKQQKLSETKVFSNKVIVKKVF